MRGVSFLAVVLVVASTALARSAESEVPVRDAGTASGEVVQTCDPVAWIAGGCAGPTQWTPWIAEWMEKLERPVPPIVYPPEPKGLVVSGLNRKVSGSLPMQLGEAAVAVYGPDPRRIAIGANAPLDSDQVRQAMFVTKDGGRTFKSTFLPRVSSDSFLVGDPTVAWTGDGTLWAGGIEGRFLAVSLSLTGQSYRSTDQGATWLYGGTFSGTERLADRPTFWVDSAPASRYRDTLYVTWHNGPVFVTRRPKGAAAWSAPVRVSPTDTQGFGGDLKTDGAGRVFAFWPDAVRKKIFLATSNNGGARFSPPIEVAAVKQPLFFLLVPATGGRAPSLYVSTAVLRSNGATRLFVAWMDEATPPAVGARIWFTSSNNGGTTWSAAREIRPTSAAVDQFHPALTIDPTTRQLALVYTDTSADPARIKTRRVAITSKDFGATWSAPINVSTAPSNALTEPRLTNGYHDYQQSAAVGPRLWTVWTDRRTAAASSIWLAELKLTNAGVVRVPIGADTTAEADEVSQ